MTVLARADTINRLIFTRDRGLSIFEIPGFNLKRVSAPLYLLVSVAVGLIKADRGCVILAIQFSSTALAASIVGRIARRPFLLMSTTSGALSEARHIKNKKWKRWLHEAVGIITQTQWAKTEMASVFPSLTIEVIPNPVKGIAPPGLNGKASVLYAGRLSEEKDLPALLEAWRTILRSDPHARLTIAGTGGSYRSVEEELRAQVLAEPLLRQSVRMPGWVDDLGDLFRENDIFVFPSLSEGMSNSLLQACAWGRVVVASDIPPNREVLGDEYPLLYPAGDVVALQKALEIARTDGSIRDVCRSLIATRIPSFFPESVMSTLEDVLLRAADSSRN